MQKKSESRKRTHRHQKAQSPQMPLAVEEESAPWWRKTDRPLTPEQMRELLEGITEIETATGIRYIRIHLTAKMLIGIRESSGKEFTINLGELYQAYQKCLRFTSPEVKRIIFMGHSPAVTLLRMLKEKAQNLSWKNDKGFMREWNRLHEETKQASWGNESNFNRKCKYFRTKPA